MKRQFKEAGAALKFLSPFLVITLCALLFIAGCGAEGGAITTDDGSNVRVDLSKVDVPVGDGSVPCVVAQGHQWDVAVSCNWDAYNQEKETP